MSLAIVWGDPQDTTKDSGFLYFDAVTAYTQTYSGKVTSHPIDGGGLITDHFSKDNSKFTVSGVFSGADINTWSYLIQDLQNNSPFNTSQPPSTVEVSAGANGLIPFLPDVVGQLFGSQTPTVTMDQSREDPTAQVRNFLIELLQGEKYNEQKQTFESNIQIVQLYEYEGLLLKRIISNLVITNLVFKEDVNSGLALYADVQFEQVRFVEQKKTTIPSDVSQALKKKASSKNAKGKQDSTANNADGTSGPKDAGSGDDTDPLRYD